MSKVKAFSDQYLLDLAIQEYGGVEGLVDLAIRNGLMLDHAFDAETEIEVDASEVVNQNVVDFYKSKKLKVATQFSEEGALGIFDETFDNTFE